jgi:hypothetical protein
MEKIEYREIRLPNGEVLQIKYDTEGVVFDRFSHNGEEHLESYGYDLYSETTIPRHHANITSADINEFGKSAYGILLKTLQVLELAPLKDIASVIDQLKEDIYKECPDLLLLEDSTEK